MKTNTIFDRSMIKKLITGILLFVYIGTGFLDLMVQGKMTYSSIMGMDISRVYFYTFFLLLLGSWLLFNKWFVGIGFLSVATFNSYFIEYLYIHNYFASVVVYVGILIDILIRRKPKWLIPLIIVGTIQGIAYNTGWVSYYVVGSMEFLALCIGSIFVIKTIE